MDGLGPTDTLARFDWGTITGLVYRQYSYPWPTLGQISYNWAPLKGQINQFTWVEFESGPLLFSSPIFLESSHLASLCLLQFHLFQVDKQMWGVRWFLLKILLGTGTKQLGNIFWGKHVASIPLNNVPSMVTIVFLSFPVKQHSNIFVILEKRYIWLLWDQTYFFVAWEEKAHPNTLWNKE